MRNYFFNSEQKDFSRGCRQSETPEDAIWAITPFNSAVELYYSGGTWYVKDHGVPAEGETEHVQAVATAVQGGNYIPKFKVAAIGVDCYPESGTPNEDGYMVHYDMPEAWNVTDRMYAGQHYQRRVTRVRLDTATTATKIILYRN